MYKRQIHTIAFLVDNRTWTVVMPGTKHLIKGMGRLIHDCRKAAGESSTYKLGLNHDRKLHYLEVQDYLSILAERHHEFPAVQHMEMPKHFGQLKIILERKRTKNGSWAAAGGWDMQTGKHLTKDEVRELDIATPPWRDIPEVDWTDYNRIRTDRRARMYLNAMVTKQGNPVDRDEIIVEGGGNGADALDVFLDRFDGLLETISWMLTSSQKEMPSFCDHTSGAGKTTAFSSWEAAWGGMKLGQAKSLLGNNSRFDDLQAYICKFGMVIIDEAAKTQLNTSSLTELDSHKQSPNLKYQERVELPRLANIGFAADGRGPAVDMTAQGIPERFNIRLDWTNNPILKSIRPWIIDNPEAANHWWCSIIALIQSGMAEPPADAVRDTDDLLGQDEVVQELRDVYTPRLGCFVPTSALIASIRAVDGGKVHARDVKDKLMAAFPQEFKAGTIKADKDRIPDAKPGKPTQARGWRGLDFA